MKRTLNAVCESTVLKRFDRVSRPNWRGIVVDIVADTCVICKNENDEGTITFRKQDLRKVETKHAP